MCQDLQAPWPAQKNRALVPAGLDGNEFSMLFRAGVPWWPDRAFELEHIVPEQEARFETDVWEERIKSYLAGKSKTTILLVATHALDFEGARPLVVPGEPQPARGTPINRLGTSDQRRIVAIMVRLGWGHRREAGTGTRYWAPRERLL